MNNKIHALLVEDDTDICELVRIIMRSEHYALDTAYDGRTGLNMALTNPYDLIILDLMLPKIDGWEICKQIRHNPSTRKIPVIMLTAKGEEKDKVKGLELGADDYIAKPFSPREFLARVKALLRRTVDYSQPEEHLQFGKLHIDLQGHEAEINNQKLPLTLKEFEILVLLASSIGRVLNREQLLEQVWGYDYPGDTRTVDEHIKRIRQKLAVEDPENTYIETIRGVGYKFEVKKSHG